jgi:hypothetical protein
MYALRLALHPTFVYGQGNQLLPHLYKLVRVLLGFYAITRNSTVDTSTVKNSITLSGQVCATLLNGCYSREKLAKFLKGTLSSVDNLLTGTFPGLLFKNCLSKVDICIAVDSPQ